MAWAVAAEVGSPDTWLAYADVLAEAGLTAEEDEARAVARELQSAGWLAGELARLTRPGNLPRHANDTIKDKLLATCWMYGFFTNGQVATRMTEKECREFQKKHNPCGDPFAMDQLLRLAPGEPLRFAAARENYPSGESSDRVVSLQGATGALTVQARYWGLLVRRHSPLLRWHRARHFSATILAYQGETMVGLLKPLQD
jgi:hypothetical protein